MSTALVDMARRRLVVPGAGCQLHPICAGCSRSAGGRWHHRTVARPRYDGAFRYRHPIEVRFVDTDALGHVNNAIVLSYFEAARAGYYRAVTGATFGLGLLGPPGHEHAGGGAEGEGTRTFIIARAEIDYRAPAFFGEPLVAECRVGWVSRSSFSLEYRIVAEEANPGEPRLVAEGETVQVTYDFRAARVTRLAPDLVARFEAYEGRPIPSRSRP